MASKLAFHFQQIPGWAGNIAGRWVKVIDPPSENRWAGRSVIGRAYMQDDRSNQLVLQGSAGAEHWYRFLRPYVARAPYVYVWEGPNEPQPVADFGFAAVLGQFTKRLAELMHADGLKLAGGCLSEGNPGGNDAQARACYVAVAKGLQHCDYEAFHCYWVMGHSHPESGMNDWHAFRYRRNRRYAAEAGIALPPLLITECGVDGGVVAQPKRGWKTFCGSRAIYMEQLRQFDAQLALDPYVLCATAFTSGPTGDWEDFEVDEELADMIASYVAEVGGPYMGDGGKPPVPPVRPPTPRPASPGATPPPATVARLKETGLAVRVLKINPDAALLRRIIKDGFEAVSNEFSVEDGGVTYVGQLAQKCATGEVRVYYAKLGEWTAIRSTPA